MNCQFRTPLLFDEKSARELGRLTGANVVLTGKIVPKKSTGDVFLRLVNVETGEILFAISGSVDIYLRDNSYIMSSPTEDELQRPNGLLNDK